MNVLGTEIPDVKIIVPDIFKDRRGYFFESFNSSSFERQFGRYDFCQDNESLSEEGVIRGLHYQVGQNAQSKLIRAVAGAIWDVAVDMRCSSPTFRKWIGVELSAENRKQLLVPKGFAHGFLTLSRSAVVQYKVDNFFSARDERGIRFDDPSLAVKWPTQAPAILSEKDLALPYFKDAEAFDL